MKKLTRTLEVGDVIVTNDVTEFAGLALVLRDVKEGERVGIGSLTGKAGDKWCLFLRSMKQSVLFGDERVKLLVRVR